MEMYSSESPLASFSACCSTQTNSFEGRMSGTVLPLMARQLLDRLVRARAQRLGVLAEALEHGDDDAVLLLEQRRSRWAGATSGLECSEASRCAAATASWDLIVKRSCCMPAFYRVNGQM